MRAGFQSKELVFAIASVNGASAACTEHGNLAAAEQLNAWYKLVAEHIQDVDGQVVKVIGDGLILTFPATRASEAITALRTLQQRGTASWEKFDKRCRVQLKAGIGALVAGPFGPPGQERDDVYGEALNKLFKMPLADFAMTPELAARVSS